MQTQDTTMAEASAPRGEESFQRLLLQLSTAASEGTPLAPLIGLFCKATRGFFGVDGVYFWQSTEGGELVGAEADGLMAESFRGRRLKPSQSAAASEAIRQRRTLYVNQVDPARYPMAAEFHTKSLMSAPLLMANEIIGAVVFISVSHPDFFNDDLAAKATILAGQLSSLLEASRLTQLSREEQRRAEILAEVAQALHSVPDSSAVAEALADRLRVLLRTQLVCILVRQGAGFNLQTVAGESPQFAASARARHDRKGLQFAAGLAARALAAGEPVAFAIEPSSHSLGDLVPAGMLIAAPFRTSRTQGAVLVYPRAEGVFTAPEKSLVAAVCGFGAVAMANAELYATARAQAHELHQMLEIASELGSIADVDGFLQHFVVRATDFLGFSRGFVGLTEGSQFHIRWKCSGGESAIAAAVFPESVASRALMNRQEFWTDNASDLPNVNPELIAQHHVRQVLAVPLVGSDGDVLGMFGVLDKVNGGGISQEDIRRAKSLAAQVAVALEVTRNLQLSEQHRRRAESLMGLALELNYCARASRFASQFAQRAAQIMGAESAAVVLTQEPGWETIALKGEAEFTTAPSSLSLFEQAARDWLKKDSPNIVCAPASELFGTQLSETLAWSDCTLVRLGAASGELVGLLCLANRRKPLNHEEEHLLQAIAGHASIAIENARLFTRMEHANRHWIETFDAITDFIVAHDHSGRVIRVNRSLSDFIGVSPSELIGVTISAMLSIGNEPPLPGCPFCRLTGEGFADEFAHPVLDRTYLVSTSQVHGEGDEGLQTIHVLKDITDRREAERRYRELFDNIQEGLFFASPDGRFIEVNDALVRMLNYASRDELLQSDIRSQVCFSEETYQELTRLMQQHGVVRNHEQSLRRKDGLPVHVLINAFAVRDPQGNIVQYRGLMLDISGLKAFQAELQRERDFSGKILNNTQSLILVADTAGLVSYANRRWYEMGYERQQLLGHPLEDLVAIPRRQWLSEAFAATLSGQQVDNLELQILRGDGRMGHFSVNLSPMRDDQGNVASIVVVMSDITDSASLQAKLVHAEKMAAVGQLVSGVAHEVNNPLTAILGFADLMMENPEMPESARKDLRVILQEAQRTKQIVQNLLSFARQMPPQRKPVQLNAILRRTVQLRAYDFHSRGVEVVEQLDPELPLIIGDSHQLQQVFLNIINNAYDAVRDTGRAGRIEIHTAQRSSMIEVAFRDNGHGISSPERIFDPFFTTKEIGKGTGLGLSICYGIVHEHRGEIACYNNSDGEGATFIVRLPIASESVSIGAAAGVTQP